MTEWKESILRIMQEIELTVKQIVKLRLELELLKSMAEEKEIDLK